MKKRGYFFTLDAFIAIGVIVIGIMLILFSYQYRPYQSQTLVLANNFMDSLANTKISEANYPYIYELRTNGTINNHENTILEQIAEFYVRGMSGTAKEMVVNLPVESVPKQYGLSLWINNTLIHNRSLEAKETRFLASSKAMVMGVTNRTHVWGPLEAEVRVWQR